MFSFDGSYQPTAPLVTQARLNALERQGPILRALVAPSGRVVVPGGRAGRRAEHGMMRSPCGQSWGGTIRDGRRGDSGERHGVGYRGDPRRMPGDGQGITIVRRGICGYFGSILVSEVASSPVARREAHDVVVVKREEKL